MTVQVALAVVYFLIVGIVAVFLALFVRATRRPPRTPALAEAEEPPTPKMARSERRWLYVLFILILAANAITLSPLIPATNDSLWASGTPVKTVVVSIENYTFTLAENPITVPRAQLVQFDVTSHDVTYGFGVFRHDGTLVFQMQVIPLPYVNRLRWAFDEVGDYDIRSTEYSGPLHSGMHLTDALFVVEGP